MKKALSVFLLIFSVLGIFTFTVYILNNKGIKENVNPRIVNKIKLTNSNMDDSSLSQVFNIYLNGLKHRIKLDYIVTIGENATCNLVVYMDGEEVLKELVIENMGTPSVKDLVNEETIKNYVILTEQDFEVIKTDKDYLIIKVGYFNGKVSQKYFIINDKGALLKTTGILIQDQSESYVDANNNELDIFYDKNQIMAKINDNKIYALEMETVDDKFDFNEYEYTLSNDTISKKLINTYNFFKVNDQQLESKK